MTTRAIFFPFDLFGSAGTKAGAELLADAFQELLADNKRERVATRARAYAGKVRFENTSVREAYGSRSSAIVVPASDALSTLAALTLPENGSHDSGWVCGTRKVALTI